MQNKNHATDYDSSDPKAIFEHFGKTHDAAARMAFEIYFLHQHMQKLTGLLNCAPALLNHLAGMKLELDIEHDGAVLYEVLADAAETT